MTNNYKCFISINHRTVVYNTNFEEYSITKTKSASIGIIKTKNCKNSRIILWSFNKSTNKVPGRAREELNTTKITVPITYSANSEQLVWALFSSYSCRVLFGFSRIWHNVRAYDTLGYSWYWRFMKLQAKVCIIVN